MSAGAAGRRALVYPTTARLGRIPTSRGPCSQPQRRLGLRAALTWAGTLESAEWGYLHHFLRGRDPGGDLRRPGHTQRLHAVLVGLLSDEHVVGLARGELQHAGTN